MKILLPALSPTMETGNLVKWLVEEGQKVNSGDIIAEIETDKATMELEAPDDGVLKQFIISEGTENIKVNSPIAILDVEGEDEENESESLNENTPKEQAKEDINQSISMNSIMNDFDESNSKWTEVEITMREALNQAIEEEMTLDKDVFLLGEEVAEYNGAYKVTQGLLDKFGNKRVFDVPNSENSIMGTSVGAALGGIKSVITHQRLDFFLLAMIHYTLYLNIFHHYHKQM